VAVELLGVAASPDNPVVDKVAHSPDNLAVDKVAPSPDSPAVAKVVHSPDNPAVAHNQVVPASLEVPSRNLDALSPVGRHPHPVPRDPAVAAVEFPFSPLVWLPLHRVQAGPDLLFNIDLLPPNPTQAPQNWLNGDIASASLLGGLLPKEEIPNE
jgi:hypothetical protein